jgi:protoporphyrinogen oxidase
VLLKRPLRNCYITYIADPRVPYTAVIEMSALVGTDAFGGRSLVYLPCYVPSDDARFAISDAEIQAQFTQALLGMYPELGPEDIAAFRVSRARQVLAVSTLDYSAHLPPMQTSIPGLYIVNSAHIVNGTLNVNETVKLANEACQMLIASSAAASAASPPVMSVA